MNPSHRARRERAPCLSNSSSEGHITREPSGSKVNKREKRKASSAPFAIASKSIIPFSTRKQKLLVFFTYLELLGLLVLLGANALLGELLRGELEVEDLVEQLVAHPATGRRSGAHSGDEEEKKRKEEEAGE